VLPAAEERYVAAVAGRLRDALGDDLVAVYLTGSGALGEWRPGRSDIDVMAVCANPLSPTDGARVVAPLWHRALACPARGLELVVYRRGALDDLSAGVAFEINLNTGPAMPDHVSYDPAEEPSRQRCCERSAA
jgi:hypothetical protein